MTVTKKAAVQSDLRAFYGKPDAKIAAIQPKSCKRKGPPANASAFGSCPLCDRQFPYHRLEIHASTCEGKPVVVDKDSAAIAVKEPRKKAFHSTNTTINKSNVIKPSTTTGTRTHTFTNNPPQHKPTAVPLPGLFLFDNFITAEEEARILETLDDRHRSDFVAWKPSTFNGSHFGKRWGVHCDLKNHQVTASPDSDHPMPWFVQQILMPKLRALLPLIPSLHQWRPNETNAIDYRRHQGHVLKSHVDNRALSKEPILNLSLGGDCYMTYRHVKHETRTTPTEKRVLLKRRCLQVLTGEARYDYSHGIRNEDLLTDRRVSLTMRESPVTRGSGTATATGRRLPPDQPTLQAVLQKKKASQK